MKITILISFYLCLIFCNANPHTKIVTKKGGIGGRIIGGQIANPLQFPYAAAIYITTPDSRHFCSGSLLSTLWILTAGQCVDGATLFEIYLGSTKLGGNNPGQIEVATSSYVLHPDYDPLTLDNDIGLIKLRLPITLTDYIRPIERLPLSDVPDYVSASTWGWGQISDDDAGLATDLQWVVVATLTNQECSLTYGSQITSNMVCVEGSFNQGTCYGDIGSSLVQYYSTGHAIPVGIASFVSFNGCESTDPSGFTRTFPYNAWIRNVTELDI